jgi:hypothetical protein
MLSKRLERTTSDLTIQKNEEQSIGLFLKGFTDRFNLQFIPINQAMV